MWPQRENFLKSRQRKDGRMMAFWLQAQRNNLFSLTWDGSHFQSLTPKYKLSLYPISFDDYKTIFYFLFSVEMLKIYLPQPQNIYVTDNHNINKTYIVFSMFQVQLKVLYTNPHIDRWNIYYTHMCIYTHTYMIAKYTYIIEINNLYLTYIFKRIFYFHR